MATAPAHAGFEEYSDRLGVQPAKTLFEASCDLDIDVRGAVASFEMRQRIVNPGAHPLGARIELVVPRGAVVSGATYRGDGGVDTALRVPLKANAVVTDSPEVLGADPVWLHATATPDVYDAIVQPVEGGRDFTLATRYSVAVEPRAGALRVVVPRHNTGGKSTVCRATLRATPGPGATVQRIRAGGVDVGRGAATFVVDAKDVAVDIDLDIRGAEPIVWTQTQPLADGWNASLVTALAPHAKALGARRVVFVVDGSRSMELVGRHNVARVVHALGAALPAGAEIEAILYDRTASRVFGAIRPANPMNLAEIEAAIAKRGAENGSDLPRAFELAKAAIDGARGQAMVIVITDGVTGDLASGALVKALDAKTSSVDVHTIILDPARTTSPGADVLRAPVNLYGGALVEVNVDDLDDALQAIDEWLRPSWLEITLKNDLAQVPAPKELRAGAGFSYVAIHHGDTSFTLAGHGDAAFKAVARPAAAAPVAALALGHATAAQLTGSADPGDIELARSQKVLDHAFAAIPVVDTDHALVVLASAGRIAKSRHQMIAGGGRFERSMALPDPQGDSLPAQPAAPVTASAIAKITLERLFREQLQPKAYACYQRALGTNQSLGGTVNFQMILGRGEITQVHVVGAIDAAFETCLVDAAYSMTAPIPDFAVNADDQTIANYPLTFSRRAEKTYVVLGDADSSSPIDIEAIEPGVPGAKRKAVKVDTSSPLGKMRVPDAAP